MNGGRHDHCKRRHQNPDGRLAQATDIVRDIAPGLLFNHSSRIYLFGAPAGEHRGLKCDPELLLRGTANRRA